MRLTHFHITLNTFFIQLVFSELKPNAIRLWHDPSLKAGVTLCILYAGFSPNIKLIY